VAELGGALVRIADSPEAFADAITSELERDTPERRAARSRVAAEHGWEHKVAALSELIAPHLRPAAA
jgi:hypothetical protein